jgi:DNA-binding transcriptional MerR regulator
MVDPAAKTYSTTDLARRAGTTPRAIRFYEQSGLIDPPSCAKGSRRSYTDADLERLQLITDLRDLDLSLDDIKQLLAIRDGVKTAPELGSRLSQVLREQLEATHQRLLALRRLKEELAAALETVKECGSCTRALESHPCSSCDTVIRPGSPRMLKVLLGHCRISASEPPLVSLRANPKPEDPAQEP